MSTFSVFRASFDGAIRPRHRRTGRAAALALITATSLVLAGGFLTILHLGAGYVNDLGQGFGNNLSYARAARSVATTGSGGAAAEDKPCKDQSWPFIQGSCLIKADLADGRERAQSVSKESKSQNGVLAQVPLPPVRPGEAETVANPAIAAAEPKNPPRNQARGAEPRRVQNRNSKEARRPDRLTREQREARAEWLSRRDDFGPPPDGGGLFGPRW